MVSRASRMGLRFFRTVRKLSIVPGLSTRTWRLLQTNNQYSSIVGGAELTYRCVFLTVDQRYCRTDSHHCPSTPTKSLSIGREQTDRRDLVLSVACLLESWVWPRSVPCKSAWKVSANQQWPSSRVCYNETFLVVWSKVAIRYRLVSSIRRFP